MTEAVQAGFEVRTVDGDILRVCSSCVQPDDKPELIVATWGSPTCERCGRVVGAAKGPVSSRTPMKLTPKQELAGMLWELGMFLGGYAELVAGRSGSALSEAGVEQMGRDCCDWAGALDDDPGRFAESLPKDWDLSLQTTAKAARDMLDSPPGPTH